MSDPQYKTRIALQAVSLRGGDPVTIPAGSIVELDRTWTGHTVYWSAPGGWWSGNLVNLPEWVSLSYSYSQIAERYYGGRPMMQDAIDYLDKRK